MKVVFVTNLPSPYMVEFFDRLARRGWDLTTIYIAKGEPTRTWRVPGSASHDQHVLPGVSLRTLHLTLPDRRARATLRSADRIVLGGSYVAPAIVMTARFLRRRGIPFIYWGECLQLRHPVLTSLALTEVIKGASSIWAIGERAAETYRRVRGEDSVTWQPYPTRSLPVLHDPPPPIEGPLHVLYVGRLLPFKGADMLPAIAEGIGDAVLRVAGSGPLEDALRRAAGDRLELLGELSRPQLAEQLQWAHVVVAPSRSSKDGWNLAAVEALAAGRPVVTTTLVGMSELVEPPAGRVAAEATSDAVVAGLEAVRADYRSTGGPDIAAAARRCAASVSMDAALDRAEALLRAR